MIKNKCGFCYEIPTLCHIETTYRCNQNCMFCYNPKRELEVNYDKLDKIINAVAVEKIPHVYISGGEPSLLKEEKLNEYIELLSKHSSVTVLTNGQIKMKNLNKKIACLGIPLHGTNSQEHELMTGLKGSYEKVLDSIKYYINEGFDVRCILVLTGYNYDKMYEQIKIAHDLGMESVYIDRYEDGGLGAKNSSASTSKLKPTIEQFRIALGQILQARKDFKKFNNKIGFGTAIPYCIDKRLIKNNITSNCGVGTSFCAINSEGEFRLCNQSDFSLGNVLYEPIRNLWKKKETNCYRKMKWVNEPCKSCKALIDCGAGCKVDANCSNMFCIDYAVREDLDNTTKDNISWINKTYKPKKVKNKFKQNLKNNIYKINSYLHINNETNDILLSTRYQTCLIDENVENIIKLMQQEKEFKLKYIIDILKDTYSKKDVKNTIAKLIEIQAIDIKD